MAALIPAIATLVFLLIWSAEESTTVGRLLYVALLGFGVYQATVLPGDLMAEAFGEERRNGTLGLLYLTGLNSAEIFSGQLAGGLMIALHRLIALFPCLLIPFVMHTISWDGYLASLASLLSWAFLCIGLRVFSAALFTEGTAAEIFSQAALLVLGAGLHVISALNRLLTGSFLPPGTLQFGPAHSFFLLFSTFGHVTPRQLLAANVSSLVLGALFCAVAAQRLRRSWREGVHGLRDDTSGRWRARFRTRHRAATRQRWLHSAPYAWLAARHIRAFRAPWICLSVIALVWLLGLLAWREYWLLPVNVWLTALIIAGLVRWTLHYSVAQQIAEDRTNGTLELLLTTPLAAADILDGEEKLYRHHTRLLFRGVAIAYLVLYALGSLRVVREPIALASYTCIWAALACLGPWVNSPAVWTTFWVCLNIGRPAFALKKFIWQGGGVMSGAIQIVLNADKLKPIPYGTPLELAICALIAATLLFAALNSHRRARTRQPIRDKILSDFRLIASAPLPSPDDPRIKSWNITDRLFHYTNPTLPLECLAELPTEPDSKPVGNSAAECLNPPR